MNRLRDEERRRLLNAVKKIHAHKLVEIEGYRMLVKRAYLYIYLEEAGTGGSCFRNLYKDFLKESMEYVDSENLVRGYEGYSKAAEVWREISKLLLEIDRGKTEKFQEVKRKIFGVYEIERNALRMLEMI